MPRQEPAPESLLAATGTSTDDHRPYPADSRLAHRDLEILRLLPGPWGNRELSVRLNVSERALRRELSHLYKTLGVSSRKQAAAWFSERSGGGTVEP
jgi:DNA-binding NarL/FixJ family response regulator